MESQDDWQFQFDFDGLFRDLFRLGKVIAYIATLCALFVAVSGDGRAGIIFVGLAVISSGMAIVYELRYGTIAQRPKQ